MELSPFRNIFCDYDVKISNKVHLAFSFVNGHKVEVLEEGTNLNDAELLQLNDAIREYHDRRLHRDKVIEEITEYAYNLATEEELQDLLNQVKSMKGISAQNILEKLTEQSPAFLRNRLDALI